jgi:hypothetical protein
LLGEEEGPTQRGTVVASVEELGRKGRWHGVGSGAAVCVVCGGRARGGFDKVWRGKK